MLKRSDHQKEIRALQRGSSPISEKPLSPKLTNRQSPMLQTFSIPGDQPVRIAVLCTHQQLPYLDYRDLDPIFEGQGRIVNHSLSLESNGSMTYSLTVRLDSEPSLSSAPSQDAGSGKRSR
jgi:hypothetical protein